MGYALSDSGKMSNMSGVVGPTAQENTPDILQILYMLQVLLACMFEVACMYHQPYLLAVLHARELSAELMAMTASKPNIKRNLRSRRQYKYI